MPEFDAIIIGTGQAGPVAGAAPGRRRPAGRHRRAASFGGTCVNTGCTPTKTLVASAYAAHLARRAAEFGVTIAGPVTRRHEEGQGAQGLSCWASRTRGVERSLEATP